MKSKKIIITWILGTCFSSICVPAFAEEPAIVFHEEIDGKEMRYEITEDEIEKSPIWNANDINPPLAVKAAIESSKRSLADFAVRKLIDKDIKWTIESVCLMPVGGDKWYYRIVYRQTGVGGGKLPKVTVAILMDGTRLQPRRSP